MCICVYYMHTQGTYLHTYVHNTHMYIVVKVIGVLMFTIFKAFCAKLKPTITGNKCQYIYKFASVAT